MKGPPCPHLAMSRHHPFYQCESAGGHAQTCPSISPSDGAGGGVSNLALALAPAPAVFGSANHLLQQPGACTLGATMAENSPDPP